MKDDRELGDTIMNMAYKVGYYREGQRMALEELSASRYEVRRLRAVIHTIIGEIEETPGHNLEDELPRLLNRLSNEAHGLVECTCGTQYGHDQIKWRDWKEINAQVGECSACGSTLSRVLP